MGDFTAESNSVNKNRIPRYIHYCWFGNKEMPPQYKENIQSWEKYCPNFKIMRWDESNFPVEDFVYAAEAYAENKMAFVSDVARIYALEKLGGVYLDTDVEMIKPPDPVLNGYDAVLGTESVESKTIGTGFMAFMPQHSICRWMLEYYKNHHFTLRNGELDEKSNTRIMAELIRDQYGLEPSLSTQEKDDLIIYPESYFTAFDAVTMHSKITDDTYCVHHFAASWFSPWRKAKRELKICINRLLKCLRIGN